MPSAGRPALRAAQPASDTDVRLSEQARFAERRISAAVRQTEREQEMPIEFRYDPEKQALFGTMTGPITLEEYRSTIEAIVHSKEHPPNIRTLWDLSELKFEEIDRSFEESMIRISAQYPERSTAKVAFIVKNKLGFGLTRMFEILAEKLYYETMVFTDYTEGENWVLQD